jgi:hypothetical protein
MIKTVVAGIAGTAVMTAGSELFSVIFKENFREPQHLETLISRVVPSMSKHAKNHCQLGCAYRGRICFRGGIC